MLTPPRGIGNILPVVSRFAWPLEPDLFFFYALVDAFHFQTPFPFKKEVVLDFSSREPHSKQCHNIKPAYQTHGEVGIK